MNVLLAPDKFKGTLTAEEVCASLERGLRLMCPDLVVRPFPLADGGEGTLDVFQWHTQAMEVTLTVHDPLMRKINASYLVSRDQTTAFIEMARASGLALLRASERNPLHTTTFGTGELIAHALDRGVTKIVLGIGGSATNDAALGAFSALGGKALSDSEERIHSGQRLHRVQQLDFSRLHPRISACEIIAICDVSNPFYGPQGAAYIYGPQKGAGEEDVRTLDQGLQHIAHVIQTQTGMDLQQIAGSGAGGGFGGGAHALLGARLRPGTEVVFEVTNLSAAVAWADVVITGEGKLDRQTLHGKLIAGLGALAHRLGKRTVAVCGVSELSETETQSLFLDAVFSLTAFAGKEAALTNSALVLEKLAANVLSKEIFS
ncbi:MAG: glycerate kinase [Cyclobacteriaceae bacterium]|jgi:glycerate kinase|nr:glycerate kinase [Cyclobacteriaceae bacterium]